MVGNIKRPFTPTWIRMFLTKNNEYIKTSVSQTSDGFLECILVKNKESKVFSINGYRQVLGVEKNATEKIVKVKLLDPYYNTKTLTNIFIKDDGVTREVYDKNGTLVQIVKTDKHGQKVINFNELNLYD